MRPAARHVPQRGISLIEALVAMAVMAFGMLGVMGLQSTLRSNSDITKQRAEAVRIAQAALEDWRAFESLTSITGADFGDIGTVSNVAVTDYSISNATFTRSASVQPATPGPDDPKLKSVTMRVDWTDRGNRAASVELVSSIAGIAPELAGSLGFAGDRSPSYTPLARHVAIPRDAVNQGDGTSNFAPPGGGTVTWVFNNTTGIITKVCSPFPTCNDTTLFVLSGFVRFTTGAAPTSTRAETPDSPRPLGVTVTARTVLTAPIAPTVACYTLDASDSVAYYCALPVTTSVPQQWSGRSLLDITTIVVAPAVPVDAISATLADTAVDRFKVCRYTRELNDTPVGGNASHPLDYTTVLGPLRNQNFLVISSGNGSTTFGCPTDDTSTDAVNGNTYRHQPLS